MTDPIGELRRRVQGAFPRAPKDQWGRLRRTIVETLQSCRNAIYEESNHQIEGMVNTTPGGRAPFWLSLGAETARP